MAYSETRATEVLAKLETLGTIRTKKMFGALAIYCDDVLFAAVMDDEFCLRAKIPTLEQDFLAIEFVRHELPGRDLKMPYFDIPDQIVNSKAQFHKLCKKVIQTIKDNT
jgi:TfoX/Sxy family transcriptional regulator of competence genes